MHEFALVRNLLDQVNQRLMVEGNARVTEIRIAVGPLSGFEPTQIQSAFELESEARGWNEARLVVETPELRAVCDDCRVSFEVIRFEFVCPNCGSGHVRSVSGDSVRWVSMTVSS